jgi:hypothetical protein
VRFIYQYDCRETTNNALRCAAILWKSVFKNTVSLIKEIALVREKELMSDILPVRHAAARRQSRNQHIGSGLAGPAR